MDGRRQWLSIILLICGGCLASCGGGAPRLYGVWKPEVPGGEKTTAIFGENAIEFTSTEMSLRSLTTKVSYEVRGNVIIVTPKGQSAGMRFELLDDDTLRMDAFTFKRAKKK